MSAGRAEQLGVLIAGGGVAGLESALALRDLAGDAVAITLLAPASEFVYRPLTVREPFSYSRARRYALGEIAAELDLELVPDSAQSVDPGERRVQTEGGRELNYDALILALGARIAPRFKHAITIDDRRLDEQLHGLIQDIEEGYVQRLAFVAPPTMPWPLPMYELALMAARRAYDMNIHMSITLATSEDQPLAAFGTSVAEQVDKLLADHGILVIPGAHCEIPEKGRVEIRPGNRSLQVDRIVALPELLGPSLDGIPTIGSDFIPVDEYCQVRGLERVWAAGDATDFPVKLGGIAAQQADVAATEIAHLAGVGLERQRFVPEVRAVLLGAEKPLYLSAHLTGGHGMDSRLSEAPSWSPPSKIAAKYLAPYLESKDRVSESIG